MIGELGFCGQRDRSEILALSLDLPRALEAAFHEALALLERHSLHGAGLGWIDVHLLASALLSSPFPT